MSCFKPSTPRLHLETTRRKKYYIYEAVLRNGTTHYQFDAQSPFDCLIFLEIGRPGRFSPLEWHGSPLDTSTWWTYGAPSLPSAYMTTWRASRSTRWAFGISEGDSWRQCIHLFCSRWSKNKPTDGAHFISICTPCIRLFCSSEAQTRALLYWKVHLTGRAVASTPFAAFLALFMEHFLFATDCRSRNIHLQKARIDSF